MAHSSEQQDAAANSPCAASLFAVPAGAWRETAAAEGLCLSQSCQRPRRAAVHVAAGNAMLGRAVFVTVGGTQHIPEDSRPDRSLSLAHCCRVCCMPTYVVCGRAEAGPALKHVLTPVQLSVLRWLDFHPQPVCCMPAHNCCSGQKTEAGNVCRTMQCCHETRRRCMGACGYKHPTASRVKQSSPVNRGKQYG